MLGIDAAAAATRSGHEVLALSRAELDICDPAAVRAAIGDGRPDAVINCAAYTQVDRAQEDADSAARVNGDGPGLLAAAAAQAGAWMVHVSTDYVFDGAKTSGPYVESDLTGPRSVYGQSKLAGEVAVARAAPEGHTIVRSSWLFGTGGPCFPATIIRVARTRPEMSVVDDQVGCPTFTPHLAAALVSLAESRRTVGVVHVAAEGQTTWFGFAQTVLVEAQNFAARGDEADGSRAPDDGWARLAPCTTAQYPLPAPRPAYSVLRSERDEVPVLAPWRVGLEEYIAARAAEGSLR
jgi:dTDP-4-dehydrorhamnose reductase